MNTKTQKRKIVYLFSERIESQGGAPGIHMWLMSHSALQIVEYSKQHYDKGIIWVSLQIR
jgi:hypothetical protein